MLGGFTAAAMIFTATTSFGQSVGQLGRGDRYSGVPWATRSPVLAQHGMVASEQPLASEAAVDVLKKGGSAVDAAIAANAMMGLMQPVVNGIGGDLFAIVYDPKTHKLYGYNGSGWSPKGRDLARMTAEVEAAYKKAGMKQTAHIPPIGSLPITVPGDVDGWFALHSKFGKLPISEDLAPAIGFATHGFPVTELIAKYWKGNMAAFERHPELLPEFANVRHTYLIPDAHGGHTPAQGEVFRNPDLAHTLTMIAKGGRDVFYKGAIAHTMDAYFKRIGGDLRYDDFADFHGEWVAPVSVNYRGYDVYELPPNGQGMAALEMLQILKHFDLKKMGAGSADTLTAMLEAKRLAYEDLAKWYADPRFYHAPIKGLLSDAYADQRVKEINLAHANPNIGPGDPRLFDGDTIYLTTADKDGMMVSLIQSNYRGMGSGLVADHLGFMF
ncbi:MAG TPA: gamma-glutamyltransferase, partial [Acidisoma sp.]|nr:gamma-glutamyltransferase [Acidisoma sp.]